MGFSAPTPYNHPAGVRRRIAGGDAFILALSALEGGPVLMSSRCRGTALICVLALALAAGGVEAQALYGSVTGTILDSSGAAVPGATVSLTNEGTGLEFSAVSDATGTYK